MTSDQTGNPVLERITQAYPALTRTERQVADFLLADPSAFTRTPISRITAHCGASAPTILRFCRAAGFGGLTDLKLSMAAVLGDAARRNAAGAPDGLGSRLLDTASELIDQLRQQMHGDRVLQAMQLLAGASSVTCMASHRVLSAASYARDCLLRHGVRALTPDSPAYAGAPVNPTRASTLGLFFCFGMPDAAMVDAITCYRRHGAGAVVVSNTSIATFAQASVQIVVGPAFDSTAAPSSAQLLPHLLLTDLLVEGSTRQRRAAALSIADINNC